MFAYEVTGWVDLGLFCVVLLVEGVAIIHCAFQRADGFVAIGTLSKPLWLAVLAGTILLTVLFMGYSSIGLIAVIGALVYLVDVRPTMRDIGDHSW
ncbi:DUF2516 family protein [Phytomonospora endophytica]|uniref:DUF2516 family protein n=1 Tax=Phytomonospora endophytica TaxID=714109 RepID=A0A841FKA9_9ACTN|nr:DUF2516 family protein [Phytomonospora endophytica]MBB6036305.1 hypothetical protein [Phytomonospora endophytica]GIG67212.1 membrane protein [Phytomonospora endophytica]